VDSTLPVLRAFIQNARGTTTKRDYNEKTLEYLGESLVSRTYPFAYGFLVATTAEDGDNLDCFVISAKDHPNGATVECTPIGLMEQIEDGENDHNVLAVPVGETFELTDEVQETLRDFVLHVFEHVPGKQMYVGQFLGPEAALDLIRNCQDAV
jgi:inorganic pyrophosphatase